MKKSFYILSFLLVFNLFMIQKANAQDSLKNERQHYKFGIGAGVGFTTGYGLSFRYTPSKLGIQLNFAPYKSEYTERYSLGLTFLYKINEGEKVNLFLYQANHYYYQSNMEYNYNYPNYIDPQLIKVTDKYINNGFGFGLDFVFLKRMNFNLMTGYAAYNNFKGFNLTIETGLYYTF